MNTSNESPSIPGNLTVPHTGQEGAAAALLQAENERLQKRLQQLEEERDRDRQILATLQAECDAYRRAAYAWALEQVSDEDLRRYAQNEEGLPLDEVLAELDNAPEAGKDA